MRVGVIGMGVVGNAQAGMFSGYEVVSYDPLWHSRYPMERLAACDFILVCVGTPEGEDGHADLSHLRTAVAKLPEDVPVAVRSTVPPGTTDNLFWRSERLYCHAPEFIGENVLHSWQRPRDVPYMILGGSPESTLFFKQKFSQVFPGEIHTCTAKEAELAKYAANLYWATRVTFVNEFANICEAFDVDYENVRAAWLSDPRMSEPYTQYAGYPPGFGGRCWPKDLAALIGASEDAGYTPHFLWSVEEANRTFQE